MCEHNVYEIAHRAVTKHAQTKTKAKLILELGLNNKLFVFSEIFDPVIWHENNSLLIDYVKGHIFGPRDRGG